MKHSGYREMAVTHQERTADNDIFFLSVMPLVFASSTSVGEKQTIGTAALGGTLIDCLLVPAFFVMF